MVFDFQASPFNNDDDEPILSGEPLGPELSGSTAYMGSAYSVFWGRDGISLEDPRGRQGNFNQIQIVIFRYVLGIGHMTNGIWFAISKHWLVVTGTRRVFVHSVGNVIIPIDYFSEG